MPLFIKNGSESKSKDGKLKEVVLGTGKTKNPYCTGFTRYRTA